MSTHKHIDIICVAVVILSLFVTMLFMNGENLGISVIVSEENENGMFTKNDLISDWDISNATLITLSGGTASVSGSGAYVLNGDVHIVRAGKYILSGTLDNGSIIVEAKNKDKIWLLFDGVSISCEDNAAVLVEQANKVFITLADDTDNYLSAGTPKDESIDGVIYSRDNLTINGSGSLTVITDYQHAIVCNDDLVISNGKINIHAKQDGIHANDSVRICNAEMTIVAGDDGITVSNDSDSSFIYVGSGMINITSCYEGLEAVYITIDGGDINIWPTDDGINGNSNKNSLVTINGGNITIINENGRDADGIDSNKDIEINGGTLLISLNNEGSNCALDYGSENGGTCKINGGTVIACGSSSMLEAISSDSAQGFIMKTMSNYSADTSVMLTDSDNNILIFQKIPCTFSAVILSAEGLKTGDTCTLSVGDSTEEITIDNSSSVSIGMGMQGGLGGMGGGRFGDRGQENDKFDAVQDPNQFPQNGELPNNSDRTETPNQNADPFQGGMGNFFDDMPENTMQMPEDGNRFQPGGIMPDELNDEMGTFPEFPNAEGAIPSQDGGFPSTDNPGMVGDGQDGAMGQIPVHSNMSGQNDRFYDMSRLDLNNNKQFGQDIYADIHISEPLMWIGISLVALCAGLTIAAFYKKRI